MVTDHLPGKSDGEPKTASLEEKPSFKVTRKRTWVGFVRDLFIYILVYLVVSGVSIGPFFWSWYGAVHADGSKWIASFYQPLAYLCEICPPLSRLINAWINWWIL